MVATISDTHPDAEKIQIEGLRAMPVWRKLVIVSDLTMAARQLALAGLRQRFPGAGRPELNRRLAMLCLDLELAKKVYGPESDTPYVMNPLEVLNLVVSRLEKLGIPYMVGGSFASSAHGVPRTTMDADLVVDLKLEQVNKSVEAFRHDFYVDAGQVQEAVLRKRSCNLIHLQTFFKVDVFIVGNRNFDRQQFSRRCLQPLGSGTERHVYLATAEDCVLAKLDWYRRGGGVSDTQWRDVIGILKTQSGQVDLGYLRKWADELGVADLLERACREAASKNRRGHRPNTKRSTRWLTSRK